jgi:hypothetical protein
VGAQEASSALEPTADGEAEPGGELPPARPAAEAVIEKDAKDETEWPTGPLLDAEGLRSWHGFVDDFRRDVYPLVAEHGVSLGEAIITFKLNELANILADIRDLLSEETTE